MLKTILFYLFSSTLLLSAADDFNGYTKNFGTSHIQVNNCSYNLVNDEGAVLGELNISNNNTHLFLSYNLFGNNIAITDVEMQYSTSKDTFTKSKISNVQQYVQKITLPNADSASMLEVTAKATIVRIDRSNSESSMLISSLQDSDELGNNIVYEIDRCFNNDSRSYQVRRGSRW
jgi:hypothetical protein